MCPSSLGTTLWTKKSFFFIKNIKKRKSPPVNTKGLEMSWLPRQNDFRTFCINEDTDLILSQLKIVLKR